MTYDYCTDALDVDRDCMVTVEVTPTEVGVNVRDTFVVDYATAEGQFQASAARVFSGR